MGIKIDILKDDSRYGKFDQVIDWLFCISSVIFAFAIPFQFRFTPWIAHWFFAVLIFKIYYALRGKENVISFDFKKSTAILSLGLFGIWGLTSTLWSVDPVHTKNLVISWLSALLIVPGIFIFSSKRLPITLMLKAYTLGCTALILYLYTDLTEMALDGDIFFYISPRHTIMRHIGTVAYHHIYLGFTIVISIYISIKFFLDKESKLFEKLYYIFHTILALSLLALDNSRIVFIALFTTTLLFIVNKIKYNWKVILPVAALFVLIIIAFCILPTRTSETILNIISKGNADDPRFAIWNALFPGLKDVPFLGYGYQAVDSIYADLYAKANCWFAIQYHFISHSQFIESFYNLGYIGLLLSFAILFGFWKIFRSDKTIITIGLFILLAITMIFDVPFFHCFVTPLLLSWLAFCYSGKENIVVKIPSKLYIIISIIVIGLSTFTAINAYKAIKKYSTSQEIEMGDFSNRRYTKKAIKKHKIKEDNISLVFSDIKGENVKESKRDLIDRRYISQIKSYDTLVCSFDYFISDDYNGEEIYLSTDMTESIHNLDLGVKGQWVSHSSMVFPMVNYVSTNANGQKAIVYNSKITKKNLILNAKYKRNSPVKGYTLFRNIKVEKKSSNKIQEHEKEGNTN